MFERALQANRDLSAGDYSLRRRINGLFAKSHALPLILAAIPLALVVLLSLLIFYTTFTPALPTTLSWTVEHWTKVADPKLWTRVMPNTLIVGFGAVLVTLFFAGPMAWLIVRTNLPFKKTLLTAVALVMVLPPFVKSMGWVLLLNERIGIVNRMLVSILPIESLALSVNNVWGIAWVMGLTLMPTTFFLIAGPMRQMDPAMEEAASICGANRLKTFLFVTMPLVWPAALAAAIFTFMTAISLFEVPAIIVGLGGGTPVLATEMFFAIYSAALIQVHNELEEASRVCGLSALKTIFFVVLPLIRPALVFATIWVALRTFRELSMALFLTGTGNKVMAVRVWLMWNEGGLAQAAAGAVLMTIGCGIFLLIGFILTKGSILNRTVT